MLKRMQAEMTRLSSVRASDCVGNSLADFKIPKRTAPLEESVLSLHVPKKAKFESSDSDESKSEGMVSSFNEDFEVMKEIDCEEESSDKVD